MPAAHQRSAMFPFCQFFTLREWVRAIDIIDSIAVVERSAELAESSRRSHPGRNYSSPIASSLPAMTTLPMLDNIWFMVIIYTAMNHRLTGSVPLIANRRLCRRCRTGWL